MSNEELVRRIQSGENDLFPALWNQNMGLTHRLINRYGKIIERNCAVDRDDMEQACFFGMREAIKRYEDRGAKFTTVYGWCAHRSMQVHLGTTHGLEGVEYNTLSLNVPISEDDETEFLDTIVDESLEDIAEVVSRKDVKRIVREEVETLPYRHGMAIKLCCYEGFTRADAAKLIGVSTTRVEQLINKAIIMLQLRPRLAGLVQRKWKSRDVRYVHCGHPLYQRSYADYMRGCGLKSFKEHGASVVERAAMDAI